MIRFFALSPSAHHMPRHWIVGGHSASLPQPLIVFFFTHRTKGARQMQVQKIRAVKSRPPLHLAALPELLNARTEQKRESMSATRVRIPPLANLTAWRKHSRGFTSHFNLACMKFNTQTQCCSVLKIQHYFRATALSRGFKRVIFGMLNLKSRALKGLSAFW